MRRVLLLLALLLPGCAGNPPALHSTIRPADAAQKPFTLNGRISITHDGKRSSASMRWTHRAADDDILLLAPFGQTVAHIHSDAQGVVLDTPDRHYSAQDTEDLTVRALGWHLPLAGLRYWVLALPVPETAATIERGTEGQISVLQQDGWNIRYTRYASMMPDSLPLRMQVRREGMELVMVVDEWEIR